MLASREQTAPAAESTQQQRGVQELGDRLLPAFDTPSGIPLSWINLAKERLFCSNVQLHSLSLPQEPQLLH